MSNQVELTRTEKLIEPKTCDCCGQTYWPSAFSKIHLEKERQLLIWEMLKLSVILGFEISPEQLSALEKAYEVFGVQDWTKCRSALERFFLFMKQEDVRKFDLFIMSNDNLLILIRMLIKTGLSNEDIESTVWQFFNKLEREFHRRISDWEFLG